LETGRANKKRRRKKSYKNRKHASSALDEKGRNENFIQGTLRIEVKLPIIMGESTVNRGGRGQRTMGNLQVSDTGARLPMHGRLNSSNSEE